MSSRPMRTARAKQRRAAAEPASTAESSVSIHTFSVDLLELRAPEDEPLATFVDRVSEDRRRRWRDVIEIEPPSPIKRARLTHREETPPQDDPMPLPFSWSLDAGDERYEMDPRPDDPDPPEPPDPCPRLSRGGRDKYSVWRGFPKREYCKTDVPQDPALYKWKERSRTAYLMELIRRDGCGSASDELCPGCRKSTCPPLYRCQECKGDILYCRECCLSRHVENPLHIIYFWNRTSFVKTLLQALGMRIQFGHPPGESCPSPERGREGFVVIHDNAIHEVSVDFCRCERADAAPDIQLLRSGWYPATEERPQTCMTLVALDKFHMATLQAKTTMYDFYGTLEKLTNNAGVKPPDRYQVFIRICREYRHLLMLKRGGRGHEAGGVEGTQPGDLAIWCPCCPRPGINLPADWENASKEDRFLYILFLALDACFRLKRGLVSSELKDPGLGTGLAYMTEEPPYRKYLLTVTDQKEMSTCSGLAALDYANTKFSRGYSTTGVGMGVCTRHEFIQPNGVGDLQRGERYANMDYIFGSLLRHHDPLLFKTISYDIVCQWWKELMKRMASLPENVRMMLILPMIIFAIPKMHIQAHTLACRILYSLNYIPGSGRTDGEGIERPWANIGGIASSTRIMGPGARHDTVDDHWGHWNWQKIVRLAEALHRKLNNAKKEQIVQTEAFEAFSQQQSSRVPEWKKMVEVFEAETSKPNPQPNPYETVVVGLTEHQVRLQFQKEEEEDAKKGRPTQHKAECLEVEEEQRRVRVQTELKKANTTAQQIDLGGLGTKLNRRIHRLRKLQRTYTLSSIVALEEREANPEELPENEPLFLPSSLSSVGLEFGCTPGADPPLFAFGINCTSNPDSSITKNFMQDTKGPIPDLERSSIETKAKFDFTPRRDEAKVGWRKLRKEDIRCMEDEDDLERKEKKRQRAVERRQKKEAELRAHGEEIALWEGEDDGDSADEGGAGPGRGEGRREVSIALRIEWAKAYARKRRWDEEVRFLQEEFRRLPISLEHEADVWLRRAREVPVGVVRVDFAQGMIAYAAKQAALFQGLADRARATETEPRLPRGKKRPRVPVFDPLAVSQMEEEPEEDEDEDAGEEEDEDDRGDVRSDEELILGGEVDDE
ncbi:hypothetical protein B0H11DRAFT_1937910 [Mycena galericulata]|nr:hypothetical protein B0H11DRAFT_1937910 [Mycena galericulata]